MATEAQFLTNPLFSEELFSDTRLSQQPTGQSEICNVKCEISPAAPADFIMRNKPNLCVFWAVSGDCEEKQTQIKPNQSQCTERSLKS